MSSSSEDMPLPVFYRHSFLGYILDVFFGSWKNRRFVKPTATVLLPRPDKAFFS